MTVGVRPQDTLEAGPDEPALLAQVRVFEDFLEFGLATLVADGLGATFVAQTAPACAGTRTRPYAYRPDRTGCCFLTPAPEPGSADQEKPARIIMTYVFNSARGFKDDTIDGLVTAYSRFVRRVPGTSAVASVSAPQTGRVSTIIGGGSGHYPSFAGLVGPGFADAAVCGDIFTSPSAEQVHRTIQRRRRGRGRTDDVRELAGDVMHFGLAAEQAGAQQGIEARIVLVTDDIASAPADRVDQRRGIAGDFFVFRAAAAAAHRGDRLAEVEE